MVSNGPHRCGSEREAGCVSTSVSTLLARFRAAGRVTAMLQGGFARASTTRSLSAPAAQSPRMDHRTTLVPHVDTGAAAASARRRASEADERLAHTVAAQQRAAREFNMLAGQADARLRRLPNAAGQLPPRFPNAPVELALAGAAQLVYLAEFYGIDTAGGCRDALRRRLAEFIGCPCAFL